MQSRTFLWPARSAVLVLACCLVASASAQTPPSAPPPGPNDNWLAQTGKMYYSSAKAGLKGFDCTLQPDWQTLYASSNSGQVSATDQPKVALLNSVKMVIHARMDSGTIVDWNPPGGQLDSAQTALLSQMHDALNQMLGGFMQFWTPFIESQVIPDASTGLEMTATSDGGEAIHLAQTNLELHETFDSGRILRQYNIVMSGTKIDVTPTYSPSGRGLVIAQFHAFIRPLNDPQKVQEMNVEVTYQWMDGFPIPAHLDMDVIGVAGLNFAFENCAVQH